LCSGSPTGEFQSASQKRAGKSLFFFPIVLNKNYVFIVLVRGGQDVIRRFLSLQGAFAKVAKTGELPLGRIHAIERWWVIAIHCDLAAAASGLESQSAFLPKFVNAPSGSSPVLRLREGPCKDKNPSYHFLSHGQAR